MMYLSYKNQPVIRCFVRAVVEHLQELWTTKVKHELWIQRELLRETERARIILVEVAKLLTLQSYYSMVSSEKWQTQNLVIIAVNIAETYIIRQTRRHGFLTSRVFSWQHGSQVYLVTAAYDPYEQKYLSKTHVTTSLFVNTDMCIHSSLKQTVTECQVCFTLIAYINLFTLREK